MQNFNKSNFIWEISQLLSCNSKSTDITAGLNEIFKKFFNAISLNIVFYDNRQESFHDFCNVNEFFSEKEEILYKTIYNQLNSTIRLNFLLNNQFYVINDDFSSEYNIKLKKGENIYYFPLMQNYNCFGFIEIVQKMSKQEILDTEILKTLFVAVSYISGMATNKRLTDKISKVADFYKAQKNIAKILETQYDYSFLIPVIGEILDNFAKDYFAYIFMKNENNHFELAWPLRYDKKRIKPLLDNISTKNVVTVNDDKTIVLFPIFFDNKLQGAIIVDGKNRKILHEDIDYLMQLSIQTATTLDKAGVYAEIEKYATQDALTGLNNRRSLDLRCNQEVAVAKRKELPLCVMMLDIDFFKKINDTYGHYVGDVVLKTFAQIIKDEVREYDFPARYGGEEFFIILPSTTLDEAKLVATRLRERIQNHEFDISKFNAEFKTLNITTSIGLASLTPELDTKKLYMQVDKALYEAKRTGRNKVVIL